MKNLSTVLLLLVTGLMACNKDNNLVPTETTVPGTKDILEFKFEVKNNPKQLLRDVTCHIYDSIIVGLVPYISTDKSLIATFTINGVDITVNGSKQETGTTVNDYSTPVTFTVKGADSSTKVYTVKVYSFTELPILYLDTESPVTSKEAYVKGKIVIDANSRYEQTVTEVEMKIKGRGNSTWDFPKKPYKLKLDKKIEMLGMPAAKTWVLLANFSDKTLMRNTVALELGARFSTAFTPRSRYVEVVMNGEYLGNYLLTDQVEIGSTRINIPELSEDSPESDISGGYLLEIDARLDETHWWYSNRSVPFTVKSPENITTAQLDYIRNYVQTAEDVLYGNNFADPDAGYNHYIDTDAFINWYLLNELTRNNDAVFFSSVYMYKDRNGKLTMGPFWDFDLAFGNINYNGNQAPEGWWIKNTLWVNRMFEDPAFVRKVKARWNVVKEKEIGTIYDYINETATYLKHSQKENFNKWDLLYNYTWPNSVMLGSYESEVQYMKEWLIKRTAWMDSELNATN